MKKDGPDMMKLIQCYMGDRKTKEPLNNLALEIAVKGVVGCVDVCMVKCGWVRGCVYG